MHIAERYLAIAQAELERDEILAKKGTISSRERNHQQQIRNDIEQNAIVIPRTALQPEQTVFVAVNDALAIRPVQVLHLQKDRAVITAGLRAGDQLVVSPLAAPVVGMKLRLREVAPETLFSTSSLGLSAPAAAADTHAGRMSEGG